MKIKYNKEIIGILLGFLLGIVIEFMFPFFLDVFIIILICFLIKKMKYIKIGIIIGYTIRLLTVILILYVIYLSPKHIRMTRDHPNISFLLLGSEGGVLEGIVRHYCTIMKTGDPFSGTYFKSQDGILYSVGPDGKDDKLHIIYDPTNGTISRGDIIVPVEKETNGTIQAR